MTPKEIEDLAQKFDKHVDNCFPKKSDLLMIPFPPQDYQCRDGKKIKTWMDGYEKCMLDSKDELRHFKSALREERNKTIDEAIKIVNIFIDDSSDNAFQIFNERMENLKTNKETTDNED